MWKGFRQNHPRREDEPFCIVTFVHPHTHKRVYSRLRGLPFGMGSVVNQFNRLPHLKTAVLRRLLGLLACHYFDDELLLESRMCAGASKAISLRLSRLWGIRYGEHKRRPMSTCCPFLGSAYDWADMGRTGCATFGVKASTVAKADGQLSGFIKGDKMTPGEASKLRGLLMWLDTGLLGRPCRGALSALVARQYWERAHNDEVTPALATALRYLHTATTTVPPRIVPLHTGDRPHVLLYTDAATDSPGLRIGILLVEKHRPSLCSTYDVPTKVINRWRFRTTYIGQGELLAGPLTLWLHRSRLQGRDITWYIDNTSAAAAMIKGSSPQEDSSEMALVAALQAATMGCRL